jgi:signal peptidase I
MSLAAARRTAARVASGLVLVAALAVAGLFIVPKALGYDTYVITTGSMRGTVDPGALVVAKRVPVGDLKVGDVITYQPPASSGVHHLVTHRIVSIKLDRLGALSYQTKGDANAANDPWTFNLLSPVQARMELGVPALGKPVLWLADPGTRKLAIGIPALAIALIACTDLVRGLRRPEDEDQVIDLTDAPKPALASV